MKKSDVELRGYNHVPAINVKWWGYLPDIIKQFETKDHEFSGNEDGFWSWLDGLIDDDDQDVFEAADSIVREIQWEQAEDDVKDIFDNWSHIKVYSDGRQGGWLTVHDLPEVESWDAIMLGKWAKAVKYVGQIVADCDYQFIWHLHENFFEPYLADEIEFAEIRAKHPRSEWSQIACSLNTELGYEQWLRTLENA